MGYNYDLRRLNVAWVGVKETRRRFNVAWEGIIEALRRYNVAWTGSVRSELPKEISCGLGWSK